MFTDQMQGCVSNWGITKYCSLHDYYLKKISNYFLLSKNFVNVNYDNCNNTDKCVRRSLNMIFGNYLHKNSTLINISSELNINLHIPAQTTNF